MRSQARVVHTRTQYAHGMLANLGLRASSREQGCRGGGGAPIGWAPERCEMEAGLNGEEAQRDGEGHSKERDGQRSEGVGVEKPRQH